MMNIKEIEKITFWFERYKRIKNLLEKHEIEAISFDFGSPTMTVKGLRDVDNEYINSADLKRKLQELIKKELQENCEDCIKELHDLGVFIEEKEEKKS